MLASIDLRLFVQQQDDYVLQYMHGFPIHLFTEEKKPAQAGFYSGNQLN